ncbi:MAG: Hpt domain-containing protein [Treponema sp.]|nr:Hpt domain-containing protein [Treponema sp.]
MSNEDTLQENDYSESDDLLETDLEFIKTLQMFFVKNYKNLFADIKKLLDTGEISAAHRLVHSLKGNAGQIERADLQKAAVDVERSLRDGKNNVTEDLLITLETELNTVLKELAALNETK